MSKLHRFFVFLPCHQDFEPFIPHQSFAAGQFIIPFIRMEELRNHVKDGRKNRFMINVNCQDKGCVLTLREC